MLVGSEIDADRTEKMKLAFHLCMLHKWGSTDMATGVCGYGHAMSTDMGVLRLQIWVGGHRTLTL